MRNLAMCSCRVGGRQLGEFQGSAIEREIGSSSESLMYIDLVLVAGEQMTLAGGARKTHLWRHQC